MNNSTVFDSPTPAHRFWRIGLLALVALALLRVAQPSAQAVFAVTPNIWNGPRISFSKPTGADWSLPENQDRITDNVWLTRQNNKGLYNAVAETEYAGSGCGSPSPVDTEWAYGTTANIGGLFFQYWADFTSCDPRSMVGQDAVVHLITDDIYIDIKFTSWDTGDSGGGFSYERGTRPEVSVLLNGSPSMLLLVNDSFVDPGATATDLAGNPVSVVVSGVVDTSTVGNYYLTYTATDSNGIPYTVKRTVKVIPGALAISVMPSFAQHTTYANAALNEPITVWGRIVYGLDPNFTYDIDFGDGSPHSGGLVSDVSFIGVDHVYTSSGSKTIRLTVTDAVGRTDSRTAVIRVINTPTHDERINMAIEKGLLWLYRNQQVVDDERTTWDYFSFDAAEEVSTRGAALMAFEENGHVPGNNIIEDIYQETVRRGLNANLDNGNGGYTALSPHDDGTGNVRDYDSNGNGLGSYLCWHAYSNGFGLIAMILAHDSAAAAQADIIRSGVFAGQSYYDVIVDAIDMLGYSQSDFDRRGGYSYNITEENPNRTDGSANQWPALVFRAAMDKLGIVPPAFVRDNAAHGYQLLQDPSSGGSGYDDVYWINAAKTGGMLVSYNVDGKAPGDADVDNGLSFLGSRWFSTVRTWDFVSDGSWPGELYAMYGVKKGLQLQNVPTVNTSTGARDWFLDLSGWLLGDSVLTADFSAFDRTLDNSFGQQPDGRWTSNQGPIYGDEKLVTASAILVLTRSVTVALPVAVIAPISDQPINKSFKVDGTGSFHQDSSKSIVEYLWDFNADDGVDWDHPDATGAQPNVPAYANPGQYVISLRVKDNNDPAGTGTSTRTVTIIDTDAPPIAVAIPAARLPAYAGRPGEVITLDGSESFDPDGDAITEYSWDLNGDGTYGDAFGVTTTFSKPSDYTGQVGLKVTAHGKSSANTAFVDIYASRNNLLALSLTATAVIKNDWADLHAEFRNPATSVDGFNHVKVKFYNGNPFSGGIQLGSETFVDLPVGTTVALDVHLTGLSGVTAIYSYIDPDDAIPESNEVDNVKSVDVSKSIIKGDLTGDECISTADVTFILAQIRAKTKDLKYDFNGDGKVDAADARWIALHYTKPNGAACN